MKILVTVKRVIDYNVQVRVKADNSSVEKENVKMSMNPPDENAGYMFSNAEEIYQIGNHTLVQRDGHSGATFAFSMRIMQKIANVGWNNFVQEYS